MSIIVNTTVLSNFAAIGQHISVEDSNQWLAAMIAQGYRSPVDDLHILLEEKG